MGTLDKMGGRGTLDRGADSVQAGGVCGSLIGMKYIEEEVSIAVGQGAGGVATSGALAPANSATFAVAYRVTNAPGGGAATLDINVTGGAAGSWVNDAACASLGDGGVSILGSLGDGSITALVSNTAAATFTLSTNSNVTGNAMKVRVTVGYFDFSAPTA